MGSEPKVKVTKKDKARIGKAQKDFRKIFEEVQPFIKKRRRISVSTAGQWKVLSGD